MKYIHLTSAFIILFMTQLNTMAQHKETRDVGGFDEVMMRISGKVYVKQGDKNEVILEGERNLLEEVVTDVEGGRLIIKNRRDQSWRFWENNRRKQGVNAYVTVKDLKGVYVSGSGDIIGEEQIAADDLTVSISGSGDIELAVRAKYVSSKISGSGNIELEGKTDRAKLSISGSGKYFAEKLEAGDYKISMSGSGRGSINVNGDLDVRISGSGKIYYLGNPTGVNSSVSGSGTVRKVN